MSFNVLVISHMYPHPGNPTYGIFVHNQVKALVREGISCRVVSPISHVLFHSKRRQHAFPTQITMDGIPIHYVPTWMFPYRLFYSTYGYLYYQSLIRFIVELDTEHSFDLIHCHAIFPDGFAGGLLKKHLSIPVISTVHGSDIHTDPHESRWVYRRTEQALRMNDHIISVSEQLKRDVHTIAPGVEVTTIYNGFDPTKFYPSDQREARRKLGLPKEGKILLFAGDFHPDMGLDHLLEAFRSICQQDVSVALCLVGDGPLRSKLLSQARASGIMERINIVGRKSHDEIPLWINSSDVVVLPGLKDESGTFVLEAMGCGKPVVASETMGIAEVVQHRKTGFLVKAGDVEDLVRYLSMLLLDPKGLSSDMSERAFSESGNLTWRENALRVGWLYEQILGRT